VIAIALLALTVACGQKPHHTVHGPSPFMNGQSVTPFPNAWFEQPVGATSPTGYEIVYPQGVLPVQSSGTPIQPTFQGHVDGYSPATPLIAYFPQGIDATQLTPSPDSTIDDRITFMSGSGSPIVLIELATRKRVPLFAEPDAQATPSLKERQGLLIHPMVRLKYATRYAVAIRTSLHDASGHALAPSGEFAQWVNGALPSSSPLWEISDRLDADAAAFAKLGIQKDELALAWDFDTASEATTTPQLQSMVSQAVASGPNAFGYTITSVVDTTPEQDPNTARLITGTFQAPSFETGPDPSLLNYDASGKPIMGGLASFTFTALIPQCAAAATGPVPILIVGHGLFESAATILPQQAPIFQPLCMVAIGTDWLGLAYSDVGVLTTILADLNRFPYVTDRLQQAHVNFQVLTRLALKQLPQDSNFAMNGHPVLDPSHIYYMGCSDGGIQGTTFLSLSQDISTGVLNVPGAEWSLMMWRSGDFTVLLEALQTLIPDKLDLQVVLSMAQSLWDRTDPIEFAPLLAGNGKSALFQESIGDPQVTNIATRVEMRTIGAQALAPFIQPVYGMTAVDGPLKGLVYSQWSIDPMPLPAYADVPGPTANGAHEAIRILPAAIDQMKQFLQPDGAAVNTCGGGACVFPR
jgi:hypothetical protein